MELPKRKQNRLTEYDYSAPNAYFITVCTEHRKNLFGKDVGAIIDRPENVPLTNLGMVVRQSINNIPIHYPAITVDHADTDLPHDLVVREGGIQARFIRLSVESLPYGQAACVSGLRIFGLGYGKAPVQAENVTAKMVRDVDLQVSWEGNATGYNVIWGYRPDKLYHCCQTFSTSAAIGGLIKGQSVYVRIDSFNDSGITEGNVITVES